MLSYTTYSSSEASAAVIAHSISPDGKEIITFQTRYPKYIHSELMTHRVFSRNASSTRAIPTKRMAAEVRNNPAFFVFVGENRPGMQAVKEVAPEIKDKFRQEWKELGAICASYAERWAEYGIHKQAASRCLDSFSYINTIITATEWGNFFLLRRHEDAQPEMRALADCMWQAKENSRPKKLLSGDWHLPYITNEDRAAVMNLYGLPAFEEGSRYLSPVQFALIKISVARCARVSYLTHEGKNSTIEEDFALYSRLLDRQPIHASPAEHQASPPAILDGDNLGGNLKGYVQFRKLLPGEDGIYEL